MPNNNTVKDDTDLTKELNINFRRVDSNEIAVTVHWKKGMEIPEVKPADISYKDMAMEIKNLLGISIQEIGGDYAGNKKWITRRVDFSGTTIDAKYLYYWVHEVRSKIKNLTIHSIEDIK